MSIPEVERQFYLGMAGIQLWYAREPLPGAAPSPEFDFPEEIEVDSLAGGAPVPAPAPVKSGSAPENVVSSGQAGERIAHLQALMGGATPGADPAPVVAESVAIAESEGEEPTEEPGTATPAVEVERVSDIRATLGIWRAGQIVLVAGISDDASERLQEALASNILAALGDRSAVAPNYVRWPVFANPLVPGNGFADLSRLLSSMVDKPEAGHLVLMGVMPGEQVENRQGWLERTFGAITVDFPHSLAELAAVPSYKRALWNELKPLVGSRQ